MDDDERYLKQVPDWVRECLGSERGAKAELGRKLGIGDSKVNKSIKAVERKFTFDEIVKMARIFRKAPPGLEWMWPDGGATDQAAMALLTSIETKVGALARHLGMGASEGKAASETDAGRKLSAQKERRRPATPRPQARAAPRPRRTATPEHPPSAPGDEESKGED